MPDVSALVLQMHDVLSQIHDTITSLDTKNHDDKLDALEAEQDSLFEQLQAAFQKKRQELEHKRQSERDEIAEKRRKEDEEIAARRKREDEELQTRDQSEDSEREKKLEEERKAVENETDAKMEEIEAEAQRMLDEGHGKISELEQKRREINSLIDEQMKTPLPPPPKRRRGTRSAPAQRAPPAEPAQPEQQNGTREVAAEESAGAAEPQEESREVVAETKPEPEKASAEDAATEEAAPAEVATEGAVPAEAAAEEAATEEAAPAEAAAEEAAATEKVPQADSVPEESSAEGTSREVEVEADEAKAESGSTDPSPAQEDQAQEDLSKSDSTVPQDASEDKTASDDQPEVQHDSTSELKETADAAEPKQDVVEDQKAEPESNTDDQQSGDRELAAAEEEKTSGDSSGHPEETAREVQPEASDAAELKEEPQADNDAQVESQTSEHQADGLEKTTEDSPKPEEESASEIPAENGAITESKQETQEDNEAKDVSNTSDHQAEDKELPHNEEKGADEPSAVPEESSREVPSETTDSKEDPVPATRDTAESEQEPREDNGAKDDTSISDPQAEDKEPTHSDEKTADEPSAHQEEATHEAPTETTESKEEPVAEASATAATEPEETVSHDEQPAPAQSRSIEDMPSAPKSTEEPTEEKNTDHSDPSSEGIAKGGAAEEYLKMADAEPDSRHEDSAPTTSAVDNGEQETSGDVTREIVAEPVKEPSDEQATSQKYVDSADPAETGDADQAEVVKEGADGNAPAHEEKESVEEPSQDKQETPSEAQAETTTTTEVLPEADSEAPKSEGHEAGDHAAQSVDHDEQPSEAVPQEHHGESAAEKADQIAASGSEPQVDSGSAAEANEEQHSTEPPAALQQVEQADISPEDDHREQDQQDPSPALSSEHKDQDAQGSRDLEGSAVQKDTEHSPDHADSQLPGDSADSVAREDPSGDQAALSEPSTSQAVDPQQGDGGKEDVEEVLEGSGKDLRPSKESDVKDSGDHLAEENFDLSGNEPIPGTMTHGKDPEDAEKDSNDADALAKEAGDMGTDRGLEIKPDVEQEGEATDSHEGVLSRDTHDADAGEHDAADLVAGHQPDDEVHDKETNDKAEPQEHSSSNISSSLDQEPAVAEGQSLSDRPQEDSGETLADDPEASTVEHPTEVVQPSQGVEADKSHDDDPTERRSIAGDSETPSGNKTPEILVSEHKPAEDDHEPDPKPNESLDASSSRELDQTGPDSTKAQKPEDAWEDRHSSDVHAARRPSTIQTANGHADDDADAGLFAVPPTPRDEVDEQRATALRTPSPPQADVGKVPDEDAGAPLPPVAGVSRHVVPGIESSAPDQELGTARQAEEDHEEDKTSQPPWLAQNAESEGLPTLQTDSMERDVDARPPSAAHSRDGSYHEDFQLSPVAYTPVDKRSRSVEPFEEQKVDESKGHDTQDYDEKAAEVSPAAPVEDHVGSDGSHQASSYPDELHETSNGHAGVEAQQLSEQSAVPGLVNQPKGLQEEDLSQSAPLEYYSAPSEALRDRSFDGHDKKADYGVAPPSPQQIPYGSGVNYDGEGYGLSPSEEQHYDNEASPFPQSRQDSAPFSPSDDRTETASHYAETPTMATSFSNDQLRPRAETPEQFHHALGNLPDESAHTVQGTDDLFEDDDDDESGSDYGEAIVESTEKLVYQANGSQENVALGGNHSSLSLGRNSMASQGSYGHQSAGSRSSLGSVRETTPLRVVEGSYLATSPTIVRADWAGDHPDDLRPHSRAMPQLQASTTNDTPGASPFALRNTVAGGVPGGDEDTRGLSASRWSPRAARPQTPPSTNRQAASESPETPGSATRLGSNNPFRAQQTPERPDAEEVDPSMYMPRDVTNTPWHARNDSIPVSLHSQTTLSSFQDSPIHSSLPVDRHEPVIRDSWPAPAPGYQQYLSSWGGRPRGDSSLSSNNGDYDPFKAEGNGPVNVNKSSIYNPFQQRGRAESAVSAAPSATSASASPSRGSGLFQKMRNVFEQGGSGTAEAPSLNRPTSGTYHAVSPLRSPARPDQTATQEEQGYGHRSGY